MTKNEREQCERLMNEAIWKMKRSNECWDEYEKAKEENRLDEAEVAMIRSDYYWGYSDGIYDVLRAIGFKHDGMKKLCELSK